MRSELDPYHTIIFLGFLCWKTTIKVLTTLYKLRAARSWKLMSSLKKGKKKYKAEWLEKIYYSNYTAGSNFFGA